MNEYEPASSGTVALGVTGCIAAYKACEIVRLLQKANVRVRVAMTDNAREFVGETTFAALTGEPVVTSLFGCLENPIPHIDLAENCDAFLIAPCTANMMAKLAHGIADDLLSSAALATTAPLIIAPAMNVHMYENAATQENMRILKARGVRIVEPIEGALACGYTGKGHLAEPTDISNVVLSALRSPTDFAGRTIVITAGPTREPIDPVRYISNRSSGKMGYALAAAAQRRGARVVLVSGNTVLPAPYGVEMCEVETAQEMHDATTRAFESADTLICTAAVSDVRPATCSSRKLKKGIDSLDSLELVENPDILATCGAAKRPKQIVVGFAAESDDLLANARKKLAAKHADMIVANCVADGSVFGAEENTVTLVFDSSVKDLPTMPKTELAEKILDEILEITD